MRAVESKGKSIREQILEEALKIVNQDRNLDYGAPEDNFALIARFWNVYLHQCQNREVDAKDIAVMMILMKVSRITTSPNKKDHWTDIAGYAACGYQAAMKCDQSPSK